MNISAAFNSSLEIGQFIAASSSNFTGSDTITLIFVFLIFLVIGLLFKMPELVVAVLLIPVLILFGVLDPSFGLITFLVALFVAGSLARIFFLTR